MQVPVKADFASPNQTNALTSIQFEAATNATVSLPGHATVGTTPIALPAGSHQVVFFVQQTDATKAFNVPFSVSDTCSGAPFNTGSIHKFVGGGKDSLSN
jgi:hypothetical protein